MRTKTTLVFFIIGIIAASASCTQQQSEKAAAAEPGFPELTGPYLGQEPPGVKAKLFAPGIVSTGMYTRDVAMTPDGKEIYYCVFLGGFNYCAILYTKLENGRWTAPQVAPFSGQYRDFEPCISPDGKKFFFVSMRPKRNGEEPTDDEDIWVAERNENGWGEPYNLGPPINTEAGEYFPSVTRDGTIYFTRSDRQTRTNEILRSRLVNGHYAEPEKLGPEVNSGASRYNAFVAPDESYLIVPVFGREDSLGGTDYYVVFRNEDDTWTGPINLGSKVNTSENAEWSPYVSPDGKYFFFMSSRSRFAKSYSEARLTYNDIKRFYNEPMNGNANIYWIDARIIEDLRPK